MSKKFIPSRQKVNLRKSWENNGLIKDWIKIIPNQSKKVFCTYCHSYMHAHRYSVLKHACTKKHQENMDIIMRGERNHRQESRLQKSNLQSSEVKLKIEHQTLEHLEPQQLIVVDNSENESYMEEHRLNNDDHNYTGGSPIEDEICQNDEHDEHEINISVNVDESNFNVHEQNPFQYETTENVIIKQDPLAANAPTNPHQSSKKLSITTHILDTSLGKAAGNIPVTLFYATNPQNVNNWQRINQSSTNNDGRCANLITTENFQSGLYKLRFETSEYFQKTTMNFLYPFVEIVFHCEADQHYHIPLLLQPFGYSTYRGT